MKEREAVNSQQVADNDGELHQPSFFENWAELRTEGLATYMRARNLKIWFHDTQQGVWLDAVRTLGRKLGFAKSGLDLRGVKVLYDPATKNFITGNFAVGASYWVLEVNHPTQDPEIHPLLVEAANRLETATDNVRVVVLFTWDDYAAMLGLITRVAKARGVEIETVREAHISFVEEPSLKVVVKALESTSDPETWVPDG